VKYKNDVEIAMTVACIECGLLQRTQENEMDYRIRKERGRYIVEAKCEWWVQMGPLTGFATRAKASAYVRKLKAREPGPALGIFDWKPNTLTISPEKAGRGSRRELRQQRK
jgi:hypothetical protein